MQPDVQTQPSAAPGWYADPWKQHPYRYWDGAAWTPQTSEDLAAPAFAAPAISSAQPEQTEKQKKQAAEQKAGIGWARAVAVFTGVNCILALTDIGIRMMVGLAITDVLMAVMKGIGVVPLVVSAVFTLGIAAVAFFLSWLAEKEGQLWALMVFFVLYALDAAVAGLFGDWLGAGLHVFALLFIGRGYLAARALRRGSDAAGLVPTPAVQAE